MSEQPRVPAGSPKGGRWVAYHGTSSDRIASISEHGLVPHGLINPTPTQKKNIEGGFLAAWVSTDLKEAEGYSKQAARKGNTPEILRATIPEDLVIDTYEVGPNKVPFLEVKTIPKELLEIRLPDGTWSPIGGKK